jgi:hypothetical protein
VTALHAMCALCRQPLSRESRLLSPPEASQTSVSADERDDYVQIRD